MGIMKYHTLFFMKTSKDVAKFVVCCSRDWHFKGWTSLNVNNSDSDHTAPLRVWSGLIVFALSIKVVLSAFVCKCFLVAFMINKQHFQSRVNSKPTSGPVTTFVICSLQVLHMLLASLYCKQYGPRSHCSLRGLIRVHIVCFHEKIFSEVHLKICSRYKKQTKFSGLKLVVK